MWRLKNKFYQDRKQELHERNERLKELKGDGKSLTVVDRNHRQMSSASLKMDKKKNYLLMRFFYKQPFSIFLLFKMTPDTWKRQIQAPNRFPATKKKIQFGQQLLATKPWRLQITGSSAIAFDTWIEILLFKKKKNGGKKNPLSFHYRGIKQSLSESSRKVSSTLKTSNQNELR